MLKWGNTEVEVVKWGSTTCTAVYWGSTKVFPTNRGYDGTTFVSPIASGLTTNPLSETAAFGKITSEAFGYCYIGTKDTINWGNYSTVKIKARRVVTGDYLSNRLCISHNMTVTYLGNTDGYFSTMFTGRDMTLEGSIDISSKTYSSYKMYFSLSNVSSSYYGAEVTMTLYILEISFT